MVFMDLGLLYLGAAILAEILKKPPELIIHFTMESVGFLVIWIFKEIRNQYKK